LVSLQAHALILIGICLVSKYISCFTFNWYQKLTINYNWYQKLLLLTQ